MGLDQYLHKVDKISKYRKKDLLQGINKYQMEKMEKEGWAFLYEDDNIDPVISKYGVLTSVERSNINWEKMFKDHYPDIDYNSVRLWHISSSPHGMTYGFQLKDEAKGNVVFDMLDVDEINKLNLTITVGIKEENTKYRYYAYEKNWVYRSETIGQWRKAYHLRKWMEDNIGADTDKDCWNFAMTKEQVMQLYRWGDTWKDERDSDIREEKRETFDILDKVIKEDKIDWENEIICYYEWY